MSALRHLIVGVGSRDWSGARELSSAELVDVIFPARRPEERRFAWPDSAWRAIVVWLEVAVISRWDGTVLCLSVIVGVIVYRSWGGGIGFKYLFVLPFSEVRYPDSISLRYLWGPSWSGRSGVGAITLW